MSDKIVIDASAVIALLNKEDGYEIVEQHLKKAVISTVNFAEVITVAHRGIFESEEERVEGVRLLKEAFPHIVDFDYEQAFLSASLDRVTKKYGLSFGDRACLALAMHKGLTVLTADKVWSELDVGVEVRLIR